MVVPQPLEQPADAAVAANAEVARQLLEAATLLEARDPADRFRVAAYRKAAERIAGMSLGLRAVFERDGRAGLEALPTIGPGIAGAIAEILQTGRWRRLERLRGGVDPAQMFRAVPGIGATLSQRIHDALHIDTLEDLEAAAFDGRLAQVAGVGARRAQGLQAILTRMLDRRRAARADGTAPAPAEEPPVALLLAIDREYRAKADAGALPTIAPRRLNPSGRAWLPLWHTRRGRWHITALYSNTARAHQLGHAHDWVVVYARDGPAERQHTIVTESQGALAGRRVVRGRETECGAFYAQSARAASGGP